MKITLGELAKKIGGQVEGDSGVEIEGVCSIDDCMPGHITFLEKSRDAHRLKAWPAAQSPAAVICSAAAVVEGLPLLRAGEPRLAFARALEVFHPPARPPAGVHSTAVVSDSAKLGKGVFVGANAVIEAGAAIGDRTVIHPLAYVGEDARIGEDCVLHPITCVLRGCRVGDRVILHSGVVIGADGYGYVREGERHVKIRQVGNVVIGDDVEIGANSAVDRATIGSTVVGDGTKIDNLVQVGHNVSIGKNCVICGQVGIAGSSSVGDGAVLAGQVGISDHVHVGSRVILGGQAGVIADVPDGAFYSGYPARPHREAMQLLKMIDRLPEFEKRLTEALDMLEKLKDSDLR
ncbi:MAG: UDP-3-O-(3-hydroxymyristoyl)glucosamine N-acyltransferase [bacterium]